MSCPNPSMPVVLLMQKGEPTMLPLLPWPLEGLLCRRTILPKPKERMIVFLPPLSNVLLHFSTRPCLQFLPTLLHLPLSLLPLLPVSHRQNDLIDPVLDAYGHSYEKAAIEQWLSNHDTCPVTGVILPNNMTDYIIFSFFVSCEGRGVVVRVHSSRCLLNRQHESERLSRSWYHSL